MFGREDGFEEEAAMALLTYGDDPTASCIGLPRFSISGRYRATDGERTWRTDETLVRG
jgi:hypothetical protein